MDKEKLKKLKEKHELLESMLKASFNSKDYLVTVLPAGFWVTIINHETGYKSEDENNPLLKEINKVVSTNFRTEIKYAEIRVYLD